MKKILAGLFRKRTSEIPPKVKEAKNLSDVLEYSYIDINRLNSYFEQLVPQKKMQELSGVKTTLGLTKVQTEISAQDQIIEFNLSEKIIKIIQAYQSESATYNANTNFMVPEFIQHNKKNKLRFLYFDNIQAHRLTIPIKNVQNSEKGTLNIWISFCDKFNLYAIEDKNNYLRDTTGVFSGYSISEFFKWSEENPIELEEPKIFHYLHSLEKTKNELQKVGGYISSKKTINILGFNRLVYHENEKDKTGIICYPIIITA